MSHKHARLLKIATESNKLIHKRNWNTASFIDLFANKLMQMNYLTLRMLRIRILEVQNKLGIKVRENGKDMKMGFVISLVVLN